MIELNIMEILQKLDSMELPKADLVVGIGDGGVVPAALVAERIDCERETIRFQYRGKDNKPIHEKPVRVGEFKIPKNVKKVLLVDDASMSGKTMEEAKKLLRDLDVKTLSFIGKADYVVFPEIDSCVKWPWSFS